MATLAYPYSVRDSSNSTTDNRKTGLTPTVSNGKTLAASPATVLASNVSVVEVGAGDYVALYDAEANGDASFPIDWGSSLSNPNDRYGTLILTRDAGRLITAIPAAAPGGAGGLPTADASNRVKSLDSTGAAFTYAAPPTDYQQRDAAVTLPDPAPSGYGGGASGSGLGFPCLAGSGASTVQLTVPAGTVPASWAGRSLIHIPTGCEATIAGTPTLSGTTLTVAVGAGLPASPTAGDLYYPRP